MKSSKKIQQSKEDVLKLNDMKIIENFLEEHKMLLERFVFVCLIYGGYRASELVHQQADWLHINDEYSNKLGLNYIQIPEKGQYCDCRDCRLQCFLETESNKDGIIYNKEWYTKIRKSFGDDNKEGRYWKPKTNAGVRKIPIVYDVFKDELTNFYNKNKQLNYSRQWIWSTINNISKEIWGDKNIFNVDKKKHEIILNKPLYPHALRATAATLWAFKGMNATALKSIMGWSSIEIADIYVKSDETQALHTAKAIADKEKIN